jgi:hypothetical protein
MLYIATPVNKKYGKQSRVYRVKEHRGSASLEFGALTRELTQAEFKCEHALNHCFPIEDLISGDLAAHSRLQRTDSAVTSLGPRRAQLTTPV